MYEPDDDDLAAEEQARSLRVSHGGGGSLILSSLRFAQLTILTRLPTTQHPQCAGVGEALSGREHVGGFGRRRSGKVTRDNG